MPYTRTFKPSVGTNRVVLPSLAMANAKLILKKARQLFQERSYEQALEELKPVLEAEDVNYNALVLAAACYDQLRNEDRAIDTAYLAIKTDISNPIAWQGLMQFCLKNVDRFYALGLQCCVFLLSHYAKNGAPQKRLECVKNFIRLLVCYRLEIPDNTPPLNNLCMLTLASDSENAYALEAAIRLFVESALFSVTANNDNQEANCQRNPTFDSFVTKFTGICRLDLHLLETYTSRLRNILVDAHPPTLTAKATVAIGEACVLILAALFGMEEETRVQQREAEEETAEGSKPATPIASLQAASNLLLPLLPAESWQRQGYLDIHVCALAAVSAYTLRDFSRCNHITKEIMSFCRAHIMSATKEVESLNSLADSQPSTRTEFLTRRLPVTPIRMEAAGGVRGLYRVCDWAGCLLLSNAALSTLGSLAASAVDSFSSNCLPEDFSLTWPSPQAITFTQCCLLSAGSQSLKKVAFKDTDSPRPFSEVALTARLVRIWLQLLQKESNHKDNVRELLSLNAIGEGFSTSNRYLTGWLLVKANSTCEDSNSSAKEVALNNFYCGIREDKLYFPNYLYAGHVFKRKKDYKRALPLYRRAWTLMPGHPEIAYALSVTYCKLGRPEEAYKVYKNVDKKTFTTGMWLNYGLICLHLDRLVECVPALQKVVMAEPANALYWELLGDAYMARGSYRTALQSFEKSMQISKDSPMCHIQRARASIALLEYSSAVASLKYALDLVDGRPNLPMLILAAKGLMEVNIVLALQDLKQGLRTTALEYIESALLYAARVLGGVQAAGLQPPNWLWYYVGFSLSFLISINDSMLELRVPAIIARFHQTFAVEAGSSDDRCRIHLAGCIELAQIFLAILVRQTVPEPCTKEVGDTHPVKMTAEGSLACICLGMLSLFRAGVVCPHRQPSDLASSRLPLNRSSANTVNGRCTRRHLAVAEVWFQRALALKTPNPAGFGLLSLSWFGLGAVYGFTGDSLVEQSAYCMCKAVSLSNSVCYLPSHSRTLPFSI
uniref:Tetratricopeptide repeat protein 37 n=1 Tax=Schistocephalus solidus TaxID=70667 RepID=A0A0X3NMQ2_SCHSO